MFLRHDYPIFHLLYPLSCQSGTVHIPIFTRHVVVYPMFYLFIYAHIPMFHLLCSCIIPRSMKKGQTSATSMSNDVRMPCGWWIESLDRTLPGW